MWDSKAGTGGRREGGGGISGSFFLSLLKVSRPRLRGEKGGQASEPRWGTNRSSYLATWRTAAGPCKYPPPLFRSFDKSCGERKNEYEGMNRHGGMEAWRQATIQGQYREASVWMTKTPDEGYISKASVPVHVGQQMPLELTLLWLLYSPVLSFCIFTLSSSPAAQHGLSLFCVNITSPSLSVGRVFTFKAIAARSRLTFFLVGKFISKVPTIREMSLSCFRDFS